MRDPDQKTFDRAKNTAYRYLSIRQRSRAELKGKLKDRGCSDDVIATVMQDLERLGYVNDREFARLWASSKVRLRGFGRRKISQELRAKGVSREIIEDALSEVFGEDSEIEIALRESEKKLKTLHRYEPEVRKRRLAGFLERKGYSSDIIMDIIRDMR